MVFRVLGRLLWEGRLENAGILIIHRGAPGDIKEIAGSSITEVKRSYVTVRGSPQDTVIPLHRIVEVRVDGKQVWKRAPKKHVIRSG
jgi:uncharacterized protein (UPF0248 family)